MLISATISSSIIDWLTVTRVVNLMLMTTTMRVTINDRGTDGMIYHYTRDGQPVNDRGELMVLMTTIRFTTIRVTVNQSMIEVS